jgi:hypothetical protein
MREADRFVPSFFVVGPPRTGTTWLHEILRNHALLPSPTKETRFFDVHFHRGLDWYKAHFPRVRAGKLIGEIAPTYFSSEEACLRIARMAPRARVVCIFRNPVERVISLYRVKRAYGFLAWEFEEALLLDSELLETSKYFTKLNFWQTVLGQHQVLATVYDDLRDNPQLYIEKVADFIGIPCFQLSPAHCSLIHQSEELTRPWSYVCTRQATRVADFLKAHRLDKMVATARNSRIRKLFLSSGAPFQELAEEVKISLYEMLRPEIEQLEHVLKRDLSAWKRIAPAAPTPAVLPPKSGHGEPALSVSVPLAPSMEYPEMESSSESSTA